MTKRRDAPRKPVGRPLLPEESKLFRVQVGMTIAMRRAVRQVAGEKNLSQSEAAALMLNDWLQTNRQDLLSGSPDSSVRPDSSVGDERSQG